MRIFLIVLVSAVCFSSCSFFTKSEDNFGKALKSTDYEYKLRMAEKYFSKKDYNHAQQLYDDLFRVMKGTDRFEDIYYKYAFCAFYLKDYQNAENLFKGFVEAFPNSPKTDEMEFMRAFTYYKESPKYPFDQTNTTKAIGFLQAYISTHPGTDRAKEAQTYIDKSRSKLEEKDFSNAHLYYDLTYWRAAVISFNVLLTSYPESERSDEYKWYVIKSNYKYASLSMEEKKMARLEQVVTDCNDFMDRFPESKYKKEVQEYLDLSKNILKTYKNEQN
ncbi:MAG: outer membrane protein assembly factor BamD [Chitinophagales bacterium]